MSYLVPIPPLDAADNLPGLRSIRVARTADVLAYPETYEGVAQSALVFHPGKDWTLWAATYTTAGFTARSEDSPEGVSSAKELPFVIPRHSAALTTMLRKAERDDLIVLFEDYNGQRYLFGSPDQPLRFAFDQITGQGRDRNQYSCRFYSDSTGNWLIYPHAFGTGDTDFSSCPSVTVRMGSESGPILAIAPAGSTLVILSPYSLGYQILTS